MDIENLKSLEKMFVDQQLSRFEKASLDDKKKIYSDIKSKNSRGNVDIFLVQEYGNILSKEIDLNSISIDIKNSNIGSENEVSKILKTLAFIQLAASIIIGFIFSNNGYGNEWTILLTWTIVGVVSCIFTYALSEIIQILHDIRNNTSND